MNSTLRCLKYWLRVLKMDDIRIPKQAYKMMILMDESEKKCWVTQVQNILNENVFYRVWLQQGVGDEKKFLCELKQRLTDNFIQEWNAAIRDKDRYFPYRNVKSIFEPEQYLSALEIYCFRVGLCQLQLGVLPVNNNLHRYSACAIHRNCVFCVNAIENEKHLLFACPLYNDIREKLLNDTSQNAVTASVENVLSWKSKTNIISIGQVCFQCD